MQRDISCNSVVTETTIEETPWKPPWRPQSLDDVPISPPVPDQVRIVTPQSKTPQPPAFLMIRSNNTKDLVKIASSARLCVGDVGEKTPPITTSESELSTETEPPSALEEPNQKQQEGSFKLRHYTQQRRSPRGKQIPSPHSPPSIITGLPHSKFVAVGEPPMFSVFGNTKIPRFLDSTGSVASTQLLGVPRRSKALPDRHLGEPRGDSTDDHEDHQMLSEEGQANGQTPNETAPDALSACLQVINDLVGKQASYVSAQSEDYQEADSDMSLRNLAAKIHKMRTLSDFIRLDQSVSRSGVVQI